MKKIPNGWYTKEFREEAVKLLRQCTAGEFLGDSEKRVDSPQRIATRQEAMQEIREYIEIFYNRQKKQVYSGYLSPAIFERKYYQQQEAA